MPHEPQEDAQSQVYPSAPLLPGGFTLDPAADITLRPAQSNRIDESQFPGSTHQSLVKRAVDVRNNKVVPLALEISRLMDLQPERAQDTSEKHNPLPEGSQKTYYQSLAAAYETEATELFTKLTSLRSDLRGTEAAAATAFGSLSQHYTPPRLTVDTDDLHQAQAQNVKALIDGTNPSGSETEPIPATSTSALLAAAALQLPQYSGIEADFGDDQKANQDFHRMLSELDKRLFSPLLSSIASRNISRAVGAVLGVNVGIASGLIPPTSLEQALNIRNLGSLGGDLANLSATFTITIAFALLGIAIAYVVKALCACLFSVIGESVAYGHPANKHICRAGVASVSNSWTHSIRYRLGIPTSGEVRTAGEVKTDKFRADLLEETKKFNRQTLLGMSVLSVAIISCITFLYAKIEAAGFALAKLSSDAVRLGEEATDPRALIPASEALQIATWVGLFFVVPFVLYSCTEGFLRGRDNVYARIVEAWRTMTILEAQELSGNTPSEFRKANILRNKASTLRVRIADGEARLKQLQTLVARWKGVVDGTIPDTKIQGDQLQARIHFLYLQWKMAQAEYDELCELLIGKDLNSVRKENMALQKENLELQKSIADTELDLAKKKVLVAKEMKTLAEVERSITELQSGATRSQPHSVSANQTVNAASQVSSRPERESTGVGGGVLRKLWDSFVNFWVKPD